MQTLEETAHLPAPSSPAVLEPRMRLAAEWQAAAPHTPDDIHRFYVESQHLGADLNAWHTLPARQVWTDMVVHVAGQQETARVVDIGCGAGHDLRAIAAALPEASLWGVEPNDRLRAELLSAELPRLTVAADVTEAPIEHATLLICFDVLEHVPHPEAFLGAIAQRAPLDCLLMETVATFDLETPLHLPQNAGWHPGRILERHGWSVVDRAGRMRVWQRTATANRQRASLLMCAYRSVSSETVQSVMATSTGKDQWRVRIKTGDALISRSRAIIVTKWWAETDDDVFLMVDDDIVFDPADADRLTELCRAGCDVICGAYPVHNGEHMACRFSAGTGEIAFGPGGAPLPIHYAATGFMACHRKVIDAMVAELPLCHAATDFAFYPLFQPAVVPNAGAGGYEWLSEDYGFSAEARRLGFSIWLDPQTVLTHLGGVGISVRNMEAMSHAITQA